MLLLVFNAINFKIFTPFTSKLFACLMWYENLVAQKRRRYFANSGAQWLTRGLRKLTYLRGLNKMEFQSMRLAQMTAGALKQSEVNTINRV